MSTTVVDWDQLADFAGRISKPGVGPGSLSDTEWKLIEQSLSKLHSAQDWSNVIRLREMLGFLVKGETMGGMTLVQQINEVAVQAAEHLRNRKLKARYLHDSGENYHRQGYHRKAIEAFELSNALYKEEGEYFKALESYFFSSLAYRALGQTAHTQEILENVLRQVLPDDPWRANPLQVLSWMTRDEGRFSEAEKLLREALHLYKQREGLESIHVVQTLADLGEVIGLQDRFSEASIMFKESIAIVRKFGGQYDRQEAQTKMKYARTLNKQKEYDQALKFLNEADDLIRGYGHYYDLLWRIELVRVSAFVGKRQWGNALHKMRAVLRYRKTLNLPKVDIIRRLIKELR